MENSNKYDSYFNEEPSKPIEEKNKNEVKKKQPNKEFQMPISINRNNVKDRKIEQQPQPQGKIIKDKNDSKTMNLDELSKLPYSRSELKASKNDPNNVEHFDSIEHLYETYGNEIEYEMVDLQDLKKFMGAEFDENLIVPSEEQIEKLEKEMQEDPQNFNTLLKLIYVYRETKHKEKLKQIREHTAALFPLSEEIWKDWIKDELAEIKQDDFQKKYEFIDLMFKRALKDFYCKIYQYLFLDFKICKRILKYLIILRRELESRHVKIDQENYSYLTIENIRKSFEDFLEIWGLDFNLSGKLWDLYLEFENNNQEFFKRIKDEASYAVSSNIIRSIYRRRLSFAHIELDIVWSEYKNWEKNESELQKVHNKYREVKPYYLYFHFYFLIFK